MHTMPQKALILILGLGLPVLSARAEDPSYEPDRFFNIQVLPILKSRCYECHSHEHKMEGGLALDSRAGWEVGGDGGPAVTPNNLKKSPLIHTIKSKDSNDLMPPDERLPPLEVAMLETWVLLGAPDPRTGKPDTVKKAPGTGKK